MGLSGDALRADEFGVGIVSRPAAGIYVPSDRRHRREPLKRDEHVGPASVPAVNDMIDARQTFFPLLASTDRVSEMTPILSVFIA